MLRDENCKARGEALRASRSLSAKEEQEIWAQRRREHRQSQINGYIVTGAFLLIIVLVSIFSGPGGDPMSGVPLRYR